MQLTCPDAMGHRRFLCHEDAIACMAVDGLFILF